MKSRFGLAMLAYGVLLALAVATLNGPLRWATVVLLIGFMVKTFIAKVRASQED